MLYFSKKNKNVIKEANPNCNMNDILKIVGQQWKQLSEEDKVIYQIEASQEKEIYNKKIDTAIWNEAGVYAENFAENITGKTKKKVKSKKDDKQVIVINSTPENTQENQRENSKNSQQSIVVPFMQTLSFLKMISQEDMVRLRTFSFSRMDYPPKLSLPQEKSFLKDFSLQLNEQLLMDGLGEYKHSTSQMRKKSQNAKDFLIDFQLFEEKKIKLQTPNKQPNPSPCNSKRRSMLNDTIVSLFNDNPSDILV